MLTGHTARADGNIRRLSFHNPLNPKSFGSYEHVVKQRTDAQDAPSAGFVFFIPPKFFTTESQLQV
jgi:hypothetical protein